MTKADDVGRNVEPRADLRSVAHCWPLDKNYAYHLLTVASGAIAWCRATTIGVKEKCSEVLGELIDGEYRGRVRVEMFVDCPKQPREKWFGGS